MARFQLSIVGIYNKIFILLLSTQNSLPDSLKTVCGIKKIAGGLFASDLNPNLSQAEGSSVISKCFILGNAMKTLRRQYLTSSQSQGASLMNMATKGENGRRDFDSKNH